jgi:hypothetical protein
MTAHGTGAAARRVRTARRRHARLHGAARVKRGPRMQGVACAGTTEPGGGSAPRPQQGLCYIIRAHPPRPPQLAAGAHLVASPATPLQENVLSQNDTYQFLTRKEYNPCTSHGAFQMLPCFHASGSFHGSMVPCFRMNERILTTDNRNQPTKQTNNTIQDGHGILKSLIPVRTEYSRTALARPHARPVIATA